MEAIIAMWKRQILRYWRSKARMLATLGQPILFLVALGFGFGAIYQKAGEGNFINFLTPGIIAMTILFSGMFSGIEVIWDRQFGFLKETLVAPVSRWKIMFGRVLGGATVAIIQGLIVFLFSLIIGFRPILGLNLLTALLFMFLVAFLSTMLGTAIATKMEDMQAFPLVINFVIMPLFFLSGALFPLNDAPLALKLVANFNPLSYGVDGIRGSLLSNFYFTPIFNFALLFTISIILLWIGTKLFESVEI